jgi:hypothetical protein
MHSGNLLPAHAAAIEVRNRAQNELNEAVRAVLLAEIQPSLERAYQARTAIEAEVPAILGLFEVLRMSTNTYPFAGDSIGLRQDLQRLLGPLPALREFQDFLGGSGRSPKLTQRWAELGRALAADADAELPAADDSEATA